MDAPSAGSGFGRIEEQQGERQCWGGASTWAPKVADTVPLQTSHQPPPTACWGHCCPDAYQGFQGGHSGATSWILSLRLLPGPLRVLVSLLEPDTTLGRGLACG